MSDTRNYIYIDLFDEAYAKDFNTDKKTIKYKFLYYLDLLLTPSRLQYLLRKSNNILKENGQYIQFGVATQNDRVTRDYSRLPIQVEYFSKILEACESNNIPVFLVMPPLRDEEYRQYSQETLADYEKFFNQYTSKNVFYLNYSINHNFSTKDFSDFTHLNPAAADIFSKRVSDDINSIIKTNFLNDSSPVKASN